MGRTRSLGVGELANVAAQVEGCQNAGRAPGPLRQDHRCAYLQPHAHSVYAHQSDLSASLVIGKHPGCLNAGRLGHFPEWPVRATRTLYTAGPNVLKRHSA